MPWFSSLADSHSDYPLNYTRIIMDSLQHTTSQTSEKSEKRIDLHSKTEEHVEVPCLPAADLLDDFPDGGFRAWVVVFGAFCISFSSFVLFGSLHECTIFTQIFQVFQAYYQQTILRRSSSSEITKSQQHCLIFLPGIVVGRLFDVGVFRIPFSVGSTLIVLATFLVPLCRVYWHFVLCQGLAIGIGSSLVFPTTTAVVSHWWKRRRGFAFGVMSCGASLGGICIPIMVRQLLEAVGFAWTLRIIGFVLMFTLSVANLCVARRLSPTKAAGGLFGWHIFRNKAFSVYCAAHFAVTLGSFTVLIYIGSSAVAAGIPRNVAFYFVAIINAGTGAGRIVWGLLGDRFGAMNVMIPTSIVVGALTVVWPHCRTVASLAVLAVFYGFTSGSYSALSQVPVAAMGGTEDLGRRIGIVNTIIGLGALCGPPLAGLLNDTSLRYAAVGYFGGGTLLVGVILIALARFLAVPRLWSKY
ncbi:MFS general substrate transporter [Mycena leptocephala]|nr:MFS general substrate transporter [Mycena leptocephala]